MRRHRLRLTTRRWMALVAALAVLLGLWRWQVRREHARYCLRQAEVFAQLERACREEVAEARRRSAGAGDAALAGHWDVRAALAEGLADRYAKDRAFYRRWVDGERDDPPPPPR